jgi:hypothetical protein
LIDRVPYPRINDLKRGLGCDRTLTVGQIAAAAGMTVLRR